MLLFTIQSTYIFIFLYKTNNTTTYFNYLVFSTSTNTVTKSPLKLSPAPVVSPASTTFAEINFYA